MTDKQIIIDGCDVSGCKYFANNKCLMLCATGTACDVYPYCYYKAYKAKEQECEFSNLRIIQLQETLSQYETDLSTKDCIVETCKAQYKELKAENEEWKKANDCILTTLNVIAEGNKKLRQTLTEIKEIAEKGHKEKGNLMRTWWFKDILQKISECEVE
jgi:hypothetical protein